MQYKQNPPTLLLQPQENIPVYKNLGYNAAGSGFSHFLDPLVEIKLSRGDSSYTFLQDFTIVSKQSEAWNRLENTL